MGDNGWLVSHTPDGRAIIRQDAFFWRALETIAQSKNEQIRETMKRGGRS